MRTAQLNYAAALALIRDAEKVLEETGSKDLGGEAYEHEAYIHLMQENEKEALRAYQAAAEMFESGRVTLKEAAVLRAIARLEMKNKNYDRAHDILEKCRMLYRENGDLLGEASALSAIGSLRYLIGDIPNARKALMKAVYLYGKAGHHFAEAELCSIWRGWKPWIRNAAAIPERGRIINIQSSFMILCKMTL